MKRRTFLASSSALATSMAAPAVFSPLKAQSRQETLLIVAENTPNMMDIHGVGANRPSYEVSWNTHDRLMTYGVKKDSSGHDHYDYSKLEPELATDFNVTATSATFKLRKDAKFHDGTPITAKDVKWSFDRAVKVGGFPTFQMRAGSLEKPEQFVAVDDHTFRVDFLRADKLTMPDLAVPVPVVMHSELCKKHATATDPWAMEWTKNNLAGGGAYKVERWQPGQEVVYARNEDWKNGTLPKIRRVILRIIPSAGNRRALLERGDADISFDLGSKDFAELKASPKLSIVGTPVENAMQYIGMNVKQKPFDNVKVRQAVAYAIPYQKIHEAVMYGQSIPLYGGADNKAKGTSWPQKHGYTTDIAKAKALLAEAGHANGFETTLSFDLGLAGINEPLSVLVQEALGQIGIKATINKIPGANWRAELLKKQMPMITNTFGGWLNYAEYFFFWCYHGQNAVFNTMSYQNPAMDALIDKARFSTGPEYEAAVKGFVDTAFEDVPRIPLFQPLLNVAMQKNVTGYRYWFHRQLDYRQLVKG
ncbi:MAG: ABC transporter substrate-binding protein [Alphaproteobacteria bacterium]|nr:ABC transporter substrate-binding protein [Alphaproteobacteria bacterium]MCW5740329.1 ABC transporter substrate-binding protein [Alphaproteobacteria bacterium]